MQKLTFLVKKVMLKNDDLNVNDKGSGDFRDEDEHDNDCKADDGDSIGMMQKVYDRVVSSERQRIWRRDDKQSVSLMMMAKLKLVITDSLLIDDVGFVVNQYLQMAKSVEAFGNSIDNR
ncbi:hypothetical protein L1887_16334 [Cichorium endivia]|nr:hypothetical protein L1887_16334 [Cichorium endivia]